MVEYLGWVDLDLGSSSGWWAATVATYCPSRMVEHPKFKSTNQGQVLDHQSHPVLTPNRRFRRLVMDDVFWRAVDLGLRHVPPGTVGQLLDRGVVSLRLARSNLAPPLLSLPETGFVFDGSRRKTKVCQKQGCDVSSRASGRTITTNPIWICNWLGDSKFAIFP